MNAYPYTGWYLTPSLAPKEATFVGQLYGGWDVTAKGLPIRPARIFNSQEEALAEAENLIEIAETAIAKRRASLDKKIATVTKARADLAKASA